MLPNSRARHRRDPSKLLYKPRPPPEPHPFLLHLKSLPSPVAAAAALLSAPRRLHDHPFASCVLYRAAERLKEEMVRRGVSPNAVTYSLLMRGLCDAGRQDDAKKLMFDMEYQGCQTEAVNYGVLMSAYARQGDVDAIRGLLSDMRMRKLGPDDASYNVLIKCLCDSGRVEEAHKALVEMQLKDGMAPSAATYRVLADGCCRAGDFGLGLRVFNAMLSSGHRPLGHTFKHLAKGLGEDGKAEEACFVLEKMAESGVCMDAEGWRSLATCVCSGSAGEVKLVDELALSS
ncbi:unnamed protein product [Triticum turgidum subsp. durum]|uniref:Pentacotripeptide-repeat region of PRORP domain-containing protein n=1 Tax=Triticum turgidum subsp. durum TaxID=4567 RepID=A0A9R0VE85_TRITD|nr:unnamed protein product [Triticum turgidum subsp. durum]